MSAPEVPPMPLDTIEYRTVPIGRDDVGDYARLLDTLLALPALAPREDDLGNMQAVVRLDYVGDVMYVTFPTDVTPATVRNAITAFDPTPPPPPLPQPSVVDALHIINTVIQGAPDLPSIKAGFAQVLQNLGQPSQLVTELTEAKPRRTGRAQRRH